MADAYPQVGDQVRVLGATRWLRKRRVTGRIAVGHLEITVNGRSTATGFSRVYVQGLGWRDLYLDAKGFYVHDEQAAPA